MSIRINQEPVPLYEAYLTLYREEEDLSLLAARILAADENPGELENIRNELAPMGRLTPIGEAFRFVNPELSASLFGQRVLSTPILHEIDQEKRSSSDVEKSDKRGYVFHDSFLSEVHSSFDELCQYPQFQSEEQHVSLTRVRDAVSRIWKVHHKSRDAASSVLQEAYAALRSTLDQEAASTRLFRVIGQKMSDLVDEGLEESIAQQPPIVSPIGPKEQVVDISENSSKTNSDIKTRVDAKNPRWGFPRKVRCCVVASAISVVAANALIIGGILFRMGAF